MVHGGNQHQTEHRVTALTRSLGASDALLGLRCQVGAPLEELGGCDRRQGSLQSGWMGQEYCSAQQLCQWLISWLLRYTIVSQNSEEELGMDLITKLKREDYGIL